MVTALLQIARVGPNLKGLTPAAREAALLKELDRRIAMAREALKYV